MPRLSSFASMGQRCRRLVATTPVTCPPTGVSFTSNTFTVSTAGTARQNGTYVASASSYGSTFSPYLGFGPSNTFWHCQYQGSGSGSVPAYSNGAYSSGSYVGGGVTGALYSTATSTISVSGEWLQMQLPHNLQLTSYTIPSRVGYPSRYPSAFTVMGSNDGVAWVIVDSRSGQNSATVTYTLATTPGYYRYFRIVFSALQSASDAGAVATYGVSFTGVDTVF